MQRPAHRSRFWLALSAAVLLHALLAVTLVTLPASRAGQSERPPRAALAIELLEVPRPAPPAAAPPAAPAAPAVPSAPPALAPSPASADASRALDAARGGHNDVNNAVNNNLIRRPPALAGAPWTPEEGLAVPQRAKAPWAPGWGVTLHLRDAAGALGLKAAAPAALPGPVHVPSRAEALAEEQARVQTKVEGWVLDDAAHLRVRDARDAYWQVVQDRLEKDFKVDWSVIDRDPRKPGLAGMVGAAAEDWKREAAAYGATGGLGGGPDAPGAPRALQQEFTRLAATERGFRSDSPLSNPLLPQLTLGAGGGNGGSAAGDFTTRLIVQILVTQGADGSVLAVELRVPSGNGFYDRLALERARALGKDGALGVPPRGHLISLWSFETDFTQLPPLPIAGCQLDAYFIPRDCFYPLKKSVKSRLKLEALY